MLSKAERAAIREAADKASKPQAWFREVWDGRPDIIKSYDAMFEIAIMGPRPYEGDDHDSAFMILACNNAVAMLDTIDALVGKSKKSMYGCWCDFDEKCINCRNAKTLLEDMGEIE